MKPFDENRIDDVFRSKLGNYSEIPPEQVFGKIRKTMSQNPPAGPSWFAKYWMLFAVTGVTGLVVLTLSFINAGDTVQLATDEHNAVQQKTTVHNQYNDEVKQTVPENKTIVPSKLVKSNISNKSVSSSPVPENIEVNQLSGVITPQSDEKSAITEEPVKKPSDVSVNIQVNHSTCHNSNGSIEISPADARRYFYYWSDLAESTSVAKRINLIANTYSVRVVSEDGVEKRFEIVVPDTGSVKSQFAHYELTSTAGIPIYFVNKSKYCNQSWTTVSNISFRWNFGDGKTSVLAEPDHTYDKDGNYIVSLVSSSSFGCKDSVALIYLNITGSEMDVPNIITPNNDGMNDYFKPEITGMIQYKCTIYNRNGEKVYDWQGSEGQWDGKIKNSNDDAADGVYYYIIEGTGSDGRNFTKKGFIHLSR